MKSNQAFTLIELLIVVAIIAILAAIAVPNFLEAQTRSKVSRVKSDMRSMATALEAFHVDNNRYPDSTAIFEFQPRIRLLTTPIAYMTSLPEDVFITDTPGPFSPIDWGMAYILDGRYQRPYVFEYMRRDSETEDWSEFSSHGDAVRWALKSAGPDLQPVWFGFPDLEVYDPTNGTTSYGDIIMTGPGSGFDAPRQ